MSLDKAWFWRDQEGILQAGLLDWGSVGQMNIARAFFGMICSAELDFLDGNMRTLERLVVDEFARLAGLAKAVLGVAWLIDAPSLIEAHVPEVATVTDRYDPRIRDVFLARAQHQILMVLLNQWHCDRIGERLRNFIERAAIVQIS